MFFSGEKVRLRRELADAGLARGAVCQVTRDVHAAEGDLVEIRWYSEGDARTATVPLDALEPVISTATEERTAVLWALETLPQHLVERVMHVMLDRGLALSAGLNVARLRYAIDDRWWKRDELLSDPSGATAATAAHGWDGCVVAFGGDQRFHLEFRLKGRGEAALLLHERDAVYGEQVRRVHAAMDLARLLMELCAACGAGCCAFPVADPWLHDEDWASLLRAPYYPDLFLLPEGRMPKELPAEFRTAHLSDGRLMVTDLPVKFAPHDEPPRPGERDLEMGSLRKCKSLGEKYYDQLYETRLGTTGIYSSAKEAFYDAIFIANRLGLKDEAEALERRLRHIKDVFRSQFS